MFSVVGVIIVKKLVFVIIIDVFIVNKSIGLIYVVGFV